MAHRCLLVLIGAALLAVSCTGDQDLTDPESATIEDPADAGLEGAFGQAGDCADLVDQAVDSYRRVVDRLGRAGRNQIDRIDAAMDSFGGVGPDLAVRYEALECDRGSFDDAVCGATADLVAGGPAAKDFLAPLRSGCRA